MVQYHITGGKPLRGTVPISGFKNAADGILPAAIMCDGEVHIENVPCIKDVLLWLDMFRQMDVKVTPQGSNAFTIDATCVNTENPPYDL
ncbi:MAG: UDP-N-acetylglucosamine 1-carboxyvinyltransferase, partial [Clostridia bacterium]|nr:UDP-N-acetylglucosamine 1-carboxyvinyltransferase [Clostridia bacterium]